MKTILVLTIAILAMPIQKTSEYPGTLSKKTIPGSSDIAGTLNKNAPKNTGNIMARDLPELQSGTSVTANDPLIKQLKRDEGFRRKPYRDSRNRLIIGYGHNLQAHCERPPAGRLKSKPKSVYSTTSNPLSKT